MKDKKKMAYVLLGLSALFGLYGLAVIYQALTFADQMVAQTSGITQMMGGQAAAMVKNIAAGAAPSKLSGVVLLAIGGVCGFFGYKALKEHQQSQA